VDVPQPDQPPICRVGSPAATASSNGAYRVRLRATFVTLPGLCPTRRSRRWDLSNPLGSAVSRVAFATNHEPVSRLRAVDVDSTGRLIWPRPNLAFLSRTQPLYPPLPVQAGVPTMKTEVFFGDRPGPGARTASQIAAASKPPNRDDANIGVLHILNQWNADAVCAVGLRRRNRFSSLCTSPCPAQRSFRLGPASQHFRVVQAT